MANLEDYKQKMQQVKDYLRHYGYTEHVRSADYTYSLFSREPQYMNMHTHVTIEVRIDGNGEIMYQAGAVMPDSGIHVQAGKTTNAMLIWRYAEQIHRMITACKIKARLDEVGSGENCEPSWRINDA